MRRWALVLLFVLPRAADAEDCPPEPADCPLRPITDVLRAAPCTTNALSAALAAPAPGTDLAALTGGARMEGPWTPEEAALVARTVALLPRGLAGKMHIGRIERVHVAKVGGREIPNIAAYTPNGGGVLQVADGAFDRAPERSMVVVLHEALHSTQLNSMGRFLPATDEFMRAHTGWSYEIVSTGIFSREYRWKHDDASPVYVGPNYGDGFTPPDNVLEEMVAMMVDYVAAPDVLVRERPGAYAWIKSTLFGGREYPCAAF